MDKILGVVVSYRRSKHRQYNNQVLVKVVSPIENIGSLIGSKVIVRDKYGNEYRGKVVKIHSWRNGVLRVVFKPNIPGQVLGEMALILPRGS